MWPPRLSIRHPVWVTKPSVAFASNSVEELFTKSRRVNVSFVKISSGTVTLSWRAKMNFHTTFQISWSISVKLGTTVFHMSRWATVNFMQVCLVKDVLYWRAQTNETVSIFITFLVCFGLNSTLEMSTTLFWAILSLVTIGARGESNKLVIGIIKMTFTHLPWNRMTFRK